MEIGNAEGLTSKASRRANRAQSALEDLRCEMEDVMLRRYPELSDGALRIYYPALPTMTKNDEE